MTHCNYWKITGRLVTSKNLHVGTGDSVVETERCRCADAARPLSAVEGNIQRFARDHLGKPYIPATEIKGALVNWIAKHCRLSEKQNLIRNALLGEYIPPGQIEEAETEYYGGKVTICDAFLSAKARDSADTVRLPGYLSCCHTWLKPANAMGRVTGAARENFLYFTELVPEQTEFDLQVLIKNLGSCARNGREGATPEEELQFLLALLDAFNHQTAPVTLGAGTGNGWGRLAFTLDDVASIDAKAAFDEALREPDGGKCNYDFCQSIGEERRVQILQQASKELTPQSSRIRIDFRLAFDEGFLINDPEPAIGIRRDGSLELDDRIHLRVDDHAATIDGKARPKPTPKEACRVPLCDARGRPLVPAESIRGVLRARAEKILRTLVAPAYWDCVVGSIDEEAANWNCDLAEPIDPNNSGSSLSLIGRLFGASGWGSLLEFTDCDAIASDDATGCTLLHQEFVAINRVSGGAASGRKFDMAMAYGQRLKGQMSIDLSRLRNAAGDRVSVPDWAVGLVALVIMDACDGDLTLGYGKAKDLGRFRMELLSVSMCPGAGDWPGGLEGTIDALDGVTRDQVRCKLRECVKAFFQFISEFGEPQASQPSFTPVAAPAPEPVASVPLNHAEFLNTYHFVPMRKEPLETNDDLPLALWADLVDRRPSEKIASWRHVTHARWVDRTGNAGKSQPVYSGHLKLRIKPITPLVLGSVQTGSDEVNVPNYVFPFQLPLRDGHGWELALPATSLRGMISSLCEAASNSALRVLPADRLTRRASPQGEAISALGLIVGEAGQRKILPLCLPSLYREHGKAALGVWSSAFPWELGQPLPLRVYIDGYRERKDRDTVVLEVKTDSFLAKNPKIASFGRTDRSFWYMPLRRLQRDDAAIPCADPEGFKTKPPNGVRAHLLGQKVASLQDGTTQLPPGWDPTHPVCEAQWNALPSEERERLTKLGYCRGILRIMGIRGDKARNIPRNSLHELFIPYPVSAESRGRLDAEDACRAFELLSQEQETYALQGSLPADLVDENEKVKERKLCHGDLVCFSVEPVGRSGTAKVTRVAVSSIWRRDVGTLPQFVANYSPRLLPVGYENWPEFKDLFRETDKVVTLAEQMFGFVEECPPNELRSVAESRNGKALASRIQFRHARPVPGATVELQEPITLKILASPKLPSPALYFKPAGHGQAGARQLQSAKAILKKDFSGDARLARGGLPELQGRKQYLHGTASGTTDDQPWQTARPGESDHQKACVRPIEPESAEFEAKIEFDNLSARELGLLCYALQPRDDYLHKLGMGKSLGLGTTQLLPGTLHFVDRFARYRSAFEAAWLPNAASVCGPSFEQLRDAFRASMPSDIRRAFELIGCSRNAGVPVHPPQLDTARELEREMFQWFVQNEAETSEKSGPRHVLKPLNASSQSLPPLPRAVPVVPR